MLKLDWLDTLGDRNPQLIRELKGRLKPLNIILAVSISVLSQFLLLKIFLARLPKRTRSNSIPLGVDPKYLNTHHYCTGEHIYNDAESGHQPEYIRCVYDGLGNVIVDWQKWSWDLFIVLGIIGILSLLVAGTYLLINDLNQEKRKGTLIFICSSPRSHLNIAWGKILGVPILLYLAMLLAVPLHLGAGLAANVHIGLILSFYGIVAIITHPIYLYITAYYFADL